jgi:hypothetical protein
MNKPFEQHVEGLIHFWNKQGDMDLSFLFPDTVLLTAPAPTRDTACISAGRVASTSTASAAGHF